MVVSVPNFSKYCSKLSSKNEMLSESRKSFDSGFPPTSCSNINFATRFTNISSNLCLTRMSLITWALLFACSALCLL
jgi:hypothetical protein